MRVIVTFAAATEAAPSDDATADLARAADVRLTFLRSAGPGIHVYELADDAVADCGMALERLRRDPRVRSVDVDALRTHEG